MLIIDIIKEIGLTGFVDIAFMSLLIYSMLVWFKRTRTAFVVIGMSIIGGIYLAARVLGLSLTTTVFQGFFGIILIAVVVIFQEEIKHLFEQIGSRSSWRGRKGKTLARLQQPQVDILVRTLADLARERIGALVVIRGKEPIVRHLDGGIDLNGELSEALLRSLFDPHSMGHDGAVVIRGNQVSEFSSHLPLSKNLQKLGRGGTRHAAALGLAELSDAMCLVVSEERGTISCANKGGIREIGNQGELQSVLEQFFEEITPTSQSRPWKNFFQRNYREKAIALVSTLLLWYILVHESKIDYRTLTIPVEYTNLPAQLVVTAIEPNRIEVTFSGTRRSFYFVDLERVHASLRLFDAREGTVKKALSVSNISVPEGLSLASIEPSEVVVRIAERQR
jgi:diadenylate cyclase